MNNQGQTFKHGLYRSLKPSGSLNAANFNAQEACSARKSARQVKEKAGKEVREQSVNQEIDEVYSAAQTFFTKMVEWEKRSRALFPARGEVRENLRKELKQIFSDHLTQKAASRRHPRYVALNYADPPEFDRPITKVEPAEPGAYWVQVEHWIHGFTRFHYVKHNGIWKTDYYQVGLEGDDWERRFEI